MTRSFHIEQIILGRLSGDFKYYNIAVKRYNMHNFTHTRIQTTKTIFDYIFIAFLPSVMSDKVFRFVSSRRAYIYVVCTYGRWTITYSVYTR